MKLVLYSSTAPKFSAHDIRFTRCEAERLLRRFNYTVPTESINFEADCISEETRAIDLNVATFPTKLFDRNQEHGRFIVPYYFDQAKSFQYEI